MFIAVVKELNFEKSSDGPWQVLGPSLRWPRAVPAAAGASKDAAKTFHTA
jgi:hypothetical protein